MADKEQVIQALRATLISVKGALTIKQCNYDYRELQGEWIPYKKLGYSSLEKIFLDVPGFKVTQVNGEWYVDAIASQETQHIASMVSKQKSSKKSVKLSSNRFPLKKQSSWRKPASSSYSYGYNDQYSNQYSNQYYRAKGSTPYNNNTYNKYPYNYNNKYSKASDTKLQQQNSKITVVRQPNDTLKSTDSRTNEPNYPTSEKTEKTTSAPAKTYHTTLKKEINAITEETKHSIRIESEPVSAFDVKPSKKISASQRLSNLRDRLNTVDLIPLHFPTNSTDQEVEEGTGPVAHVAAACSLEPPPDCDSSVAKLQWTCRKLGLPEPVYKVHEIRPKRGMPTYDCNCKVGTYSASSYPDSSPSEELAREVVAMKLVAVIEGSAAGGLPTSSAARALDGLAQLVADHEAGLWANIVPHLYREKYGENLPSNWQELVENCPRIIKDRVVNGLLVLLPNNEEGGVPAVVGGAGGAGDAGLGLGEEALESDLPPLQFPDEDFWNVYVTVANSTLEIWFRIIGPQYSDEFEALLADMGSYYERYGTSVDKSMIIKNAWYAVNVEDGGWQRAKVLEVEEGAASVFLGDHGDDDVVPLHHIKILEPQFRRLPAQAVLCRLEGCEEMACSPAGAALAQRRLPGEVLVAAPGVRADPADPSVAVVLYDTSTARDLNLNKELASDFCTAGAFTLTQKQPCEVEVGCVSEEGRVWVSRAGGARTVRDALALLTAGPYRRPLPAAPQAPAPNSRTLYIVKTLANDWVRCTIISPLDSEGTVRTQLVDSGLVMRAPLSSLVPLQAFSPVLNDYPYQAMQVRLGPAEKVASSMAKRLRELLLDQPVLCRALPPGAGGVGGAGGAGGPHVELFVRSSPKNILVPVNNAIVTEFEFLHPGKLKTEEIEQPNAVEALNKKKERIYRSLSTAGEGGAGGAGGERPAPAVHPACPALPAPPLPAPGKCFDVFIAMAANPWNFVVQPNSTRHALQAMMASLQAECPKLSEADAPASPAGGELYTVCYEKDASWYRVSVSNVVSTEMVSVYFCDYGDLALFQNRQLRPLPPASAAPLARTLPPQAIKAKLYDVWPVHQDWMVEDCIRFQELCVEQQFVGVCKQVGRDPLHPNEPLLTLDLIDTSTDEDIYLNQQLVAEGRARLASAASQPATPSASPAPAPATPPT